MSAIKDGSDVLFYYNRSKKWLLKVSSGESFHTHIGVINHADAVGKEYGSRVLTSKDKYVYLLMPTIHDYVMKVQHGTQIVYPKDLGYIAARMGIASGQRIVEVGTGSGALTLFMASIVRPHGHVHTFDVNEKFMEIARKNIARAGMTEYVTMHAEDLSCAQDTPLSDMDAALIDLGDPCSVVPQVRQMLKGSGGLCAICPTMNQLERLTACLVQNEFTDIESSEHILRTIEAREGRTRHSFQGIGHTAYLCIARKAHFGRESAGSELCGQP